MRAGSGRLRAWHAEAALLVLCLGAMPACRDGSKATVTGTVKYKGEVVPSGQVIFYGAGDRSAIALIDERGEYKAINVPLGPVTVAVITPPSTAGMEKAAKQMKNRFGKGNPYPDSVKTVVIPKRYSDPAQSGLSLKVKAGSQPFDIDLK